MKKVSIAVNGMTCPSCMTTVGSAVEKMKGIEEAKVLFNAGKVKATFDESLISPEQISSAIEQLGYEVKKTVVKDM